MLHQDVKDEEQAIAGIGDDEVREDGMGMAAGTDKAQDAEAVVDGGAAYEVNPGAVVIEVDSADTPCSAVGPDLQLGTERIKS